MILLLIILALVISSYKIGRNNPKQVVVYKKTPQRVKFFKVSKEVAALDPHHNVARTNHYLKLTLKVLGIKGTV